jgi:hypothetical protein
LTRWRSGVRARTGLPSILLILLNRGRESLRNLAKLVTIRHQLQKVFDRIPQVRGNQHCVELERCGRLASCTCASLREAPAACNKVAWVRLSVCQLSHGAPIFCPAGLKCRCGKIRIAERISVARLKHQALVVGPLAFPDPRCRRTTCPIVRLHTQVKIVTLAATSQGGIIGSNLPCSRTLD